MLNLALLGGICLKAGKKWKEGEKSWKEFKGLNIWVLKGKYLSLQQKLYAF